MQRAFFPTVLLTLLGVTAAATADDWPQWRGPNRDGKSAETGLLKSWPEEGPTLVWAANTAGIGLGSPSVADGKVYVMGNGEKQGMNMEWVVCLDDKTGEQLWACRTGSIRSKGGGYPGPRSTPTVADGKVYAVGLAGRLLCCDAKSGAPVWYRDMTRHFGGKEPRWGYSESFLVDGDRVICTPGGQNTVVALDAKNGRTIWTAQAGDPAAYASIIKAEFDETPQYVAFTDRGLLGIRASDGEVLWRYDAPSNGQANCNTPVTVGSTVFAASGFGKGGGCAWIRKDDEDKFTAEGLYFTNRIQCLHGGYVVVDNHLYGCADPGVLVSMNYKTGTVTRAVRTGRFSIAHADGMLYVRNESGQMDLYTASPTKLVRRGSFEQPHRSDSKAWPHPVIANGRLYLRDQYVVLCYDIAEEKEEKEAEKTEGEPEKSEPEEPKETKPPEERKATETTRETPL
jgi:outer membrane protein assembly factor BamB